MTDRLKGKVAIVTGGGSRGPGIGNGKAAATLFAREGARVLCVDLEVKRAQETVDVILSEGGIASAWAGDVTRREDCRRMVSAAIERYGALDILHNNVGIESRKDLLETSEEEWDRVMAVDLKSMLLATQAAAVPMVQRGAGAVICVSSVAALRGHGRPWSRAWGRRCASAGAARRPSVPRAPGGTWAGPRSISPATRRAG